MTESQRAERNTYDPFTTKRSLNEARAELAERNERRGRVIPETTVVIRLPRLSTNQNVVEVPLQTTSNPNDETFSRQYVCPNISERENQSGDNNP